MGKKNIKRKMFIFLFLISLFFIMNKGIVSGAVADKRVSESSDDKNEEEQTEAIPFGGLILKTHYCNCTRNYFFTIYDLYSKSMKSILVSPPFSELYANYIFSKDQWTLGTYSTNSEEKCLSGFFCAHIPVDGVIDSKPGAGSSPLSFGKNEKETNNSNSENTEATKATEQSSNNLESSGKVSVTSGINNNSSSGATTIRSFSETKGSGKIEIKKDPGYQGFSDFNIQQNTVSGVETFQGAASLWGGSLGAFGSIDSYGSFLNQ
jgi:hypothetical protein